MDIELTITYEGTAPGLSDHRLSLGAFAEPLARLLKALQRTASSIISQTGDDPDYGSRGGKLAADAKYLDLELARLGEGSTVATLVCSIRRPSALPGSQVPMPFEMSDLMQASTLKLLEDIDAERAGKPRSSAVRSYLYALPSGITNQKYAVKRGGSILKEVAFDNAELVCLPPQLPKIKRYSGKITSVGFEPGASFITLRTNKNNALKVSATPTQVEKALSLRSDEVFVATLEGDECCLLWIRGVHEVITPPTIENTLHYAHAQWGRTLETLAK